MTQTLDYKPTRLEILQREQREADQARQHALQAAIDQRATDVRDWAALPGKKKDHAKLFAELAALQAKHNSLLAEAHNIAKNQAPPLRAKYDALDAAVTGQTALRDRLVAGAPAEARDAYLSAKQTRDEIRFAIQSAEGAVKTAAEAVRVLAGPTSLDQARGVTKFNFDHKTAQEQVAAGEAAERELPALRKRLASAEAAVAAALVDCCKA
jgi:hypothetical protein